jgi:hypothetical protein
MRCREEKESASVLFGAIRPTAIFVLLCCGAIAAPAHAQGSGNQAGFMNSGQTATLDRAGGKAEVMGSNDVLTVSGKCSGLDLFGSNNKLTIQFASTGKIAILGSNTPSGGPAWTANHPR